MTKTRLPRLNHVAMSMAAAALDAEGRKAITAFYGDVFGWLEYDMLTQDRKRLVMRVHTDEQFVFLIAEDEPMSCPRLDHFGMSVATLGEFEDLYAKVQAKAAADPQVDVVERDVESYEGYLNLHNFYVRYKLPLMVEVQHFEYTHSS
ncbi:MAG TPA: hypothetical protein VGZ52_13030 [Acidimicrobiales bacterium]|jgi:hypothetical protein|nr:hypothetical protein [Acidimicrobiales bacterium]